MTISKTDATSLVRRVTIDAPVATVFKYLTDPSLMTKWMGRNCIFEPFEGGEYRCEISDTTVAGGRVVEVEQDRKIVYTFGWEGEENPVQLGSSKVEITLEEKDGSTLVVLSHTELAGAVAEHGMGWDHYLSRLAVVATGGDAGVDPNSLTPSEK